MTKIATWSSAKGELYTSTTGSAAVRRGHHYYMRTAAGVAKFAARLSVTRRSENGSCAEFYSAELVCGVGY